MTINLNMQVRKIKAGELDQWDENNGSFELLDKILIAK